MSESTYIHPSSDDETARLERQALLYGGVEFLEPFLAESPSKVLDVGCGSGHFTRHVARCVPEAEVVGLDMDPSRLEFARGQEGAGNVRYERGDVGTLPFEDDAFDLVYTRFVLVHFDDPRQALCEMIRVTRPGGRIVAFDMIHSGVWFSPAKTALTTVIDEAMAWLREQGAEPDQGLHLPVLMNEIGLEDVGFDTRAHTAMSPDPRFDAHCDNWLSTAEGLSAILEPRIGREIIEAAKKELAPSDERQLVIETTVLAHGTKPSI